MKNLSELLDVLKGLVNFSYSPYSKFRVSAVLYGKDGMVTGVNIENASYGLTMCAERVAVFKAISEGKKSFDTLIVYSPDGMPFPCGACRQVLSEFFPQDFRVIVASGKRIEEFTLGELLPYTFEL